MTTRKEYVTSKTSAAYPPTNVRNAVADNRFRSQCSCCYRHFMPDEPHLRVFSHQLLLASTGPNGEKNVGAGVTRICLACAVSPDYPHSQNKVIKFGVKAAHE